ncbi:MAG: phosphopantothenoylcysteine decarboxylase [Streptococcaceae bacterium]|jgi:phosphopantothenoylcysteine decarboxylase|nr:phosphopantothenoylcysteine decarboxylase [Streptococcaceae bacterium]
MTKLIFLGVSSSIAAYKANDLVFGFKKKGFDVQVALTKNAQALTSINTLQSLSSHEVITEVQQEIDPSIILHVWLAQNCDAFVLAPASANIIGKLANGIADDFITTAALALPKTTKKFIAPAMNTTMFENPFVQENLKRLEKAGFIVIEPRTSLLACGVEGKGAMESTNNILQLVEQSLTH